MLTVREAMQRCAQNGVVIRHSHPGSNEWRVTLVEWDAEQRETGAYYTDDLEDAVLTGSKMRQFSISFLRGD